jgi:ATP-dependent exoDNAse (exonuclease V) beta subunit
LEKKTIFARIKILEMKTENTSNLVVYRASAGSGKTYMLALEYIRKLINAYFSTGYLHEHRHILAVTFTNASTNEMKLRILKELFDLKQGQDRRFYENLIKNQNWKKEGESDEQLFVKVQNASSKILSSILHDYSRFNVLTIDAFFQLLLRNLARELNLGASFLLEIESETPIEMAVRQFLQDKTKSQDVSDALMSLQTKNLLEEKVNWDIRQSLFDFAKKMLNTEQYLAVADHLFEDSTSTDLLKEIKNKLNEKKNEIDSEVTTKIETWKMLIVGNEPKDGRNAYQQFSDRMNHQRIWEILDSKSVRGCLDGTKSLATKGKSYTTFCEENEEKIVGQMQDVIAFLEKYSSIYFAIECVLENFDKLYLVKGISNTLNELNRLNNIFLLSYTNIVLSTMIKDGDAPFLFEKIGGRIHHVMIDEFQDTSMLQWQCFKVLINEIVASKNSSGLLVGDVKQAIYRWRNSDWKILQNIENQFDAQNVDVISLDTNYRSYDNVIDFNNELFAVAILENENLKNKNLDLTSIYNGIRQKKTGKSGGFAQVMIFENQENDNKEIFDSKVYDEIIVELKRLKQSGVKATDICVLCRSNREIDAITQYFNEKKQHESDVEFYSYLTIIANYAYQLDNSWVIRFVIAMLRYLVDSKDTIALSTAYLLCKKQLASIEEMKKYFEENGFLQTINQIDLVSLCRYLIAQLRIVNLDITSEVDYIFTFYDSLSSYVTNHDSDILRFLDFWDKKMYKTEINVEGSGQEGIQAMTVHKSKGLEMHTVVLPMLGNSWNLSKSGGLIWAKNNFSEEDKIGKDFGEKPEIFPVVYNSKLEKTSFVNDFQNEQIAQIVDDLNLFYVAITRAKCNLLIFSKKSNESANSINQMLNINPQNLINLDKKILKIKDFSEENQTWKFGFSYGEIEPSLQRNCQFEETSNPFDEKKISTQLIENYELKNEKNICFKASRESESLIYGFDSRDEGTFYHDIFSRIKYMTDKDFLTLDQINNPIKKAVSFWVSEGRILPEKEFDFVKKIAEWLQFEKIKSFFTSRYIVLNERSFIVQKPSESDTLTHLRPDRILVDKETKDVIVLDYKFGDVEEKSLKKYQQQIEKYKSILKEMNFSSVKGFLWYPKAQKLFEV